MVKCTKNMRSVSTPVGKILFKKGKKYKILSTDKTGEVILMDEIGKRHLVKMDEEDCDFFNQYFKYI